MVSNMPKTTRDIYRRHLAQAYININWAATKLLDLYNTFNPVHPELGVLLKAILEGLDIDTEIIQQFAISAWGKIPEDWYSWAGTNRPTYSERENTEGLSEADSTIEDTTSIKEETNDSG